MSVGTVTLERVAQDGVREHFSLNSEVSGDSKLMRDTRTGVVFVRTDESRQNVIHPPSNLDLRPLGFGGPINDRALSAGKQAIKSTH